MIAALVLLFAVTIVTTQQEPVQDFEPVAEMYSSVNTAFKDDKYVFLQQSEIEKPTKKTFRKSTVESAEKNTEINSKKTIENNACNLNTALEITFEHDSVFIKPYYKRLIKESVRKAVDCGVKTLHVHGYASPDGQYAYNIRLAKKRATTVKSFISRFQNGLNIKVFNPKDGREIYKRKAVVFFSKSEQNK